MATAMTTFGNTLSEIQAGTNADKALDYQRANAQDAINAQRLEAFLRLRGQELQTKAQQNEKAADRAQRMAELLQDSKSRLDVAKVTAEGRGNPQLEGLKLELQQEEAEKKSLSDARRKIVEEMKGLEKAQTFWDFGDPNDIGSRWTSKRYGELREALSKLDSIAAPLRLSPSPYGGYAGYDVAPPIVPNPNPVAPVSPSSQTPVPAMLQPVTPVVPATGAAYMGMGGMLPSSANRVVAPVPPMIQTPPASTSRTNRFRQTTNGGWMPVY